MTQTLHSTHLWRNRSFAVWTLGTAQSQFGTALSSIALSFLVLQETGSIGGLSLTLALTLAPNILMPLAGAYIDRIGVKMPLVLGDAARGVLQLTLAGAALMLGNLPTELIYAVALLNGLVGAFATPAGNSALPLLVKPADLQRANGLMDSLRNGAWLAGYAAGGVLVAAFGPAWTLALDGATYLLAAGLVAALVHFQPRQSDLQATARKSIWADVKSAVDVLRNNRVLALIPPLGLLVNAAFAPTLVLMPAVMQQMGQGAAGYSMYLMLETVGSVASGALFARFGAKWPAREAVTLGYALLTVALGGMAVTHSYGAYLAWALLMGVGLGVTNTPTLTLIGWLVPGTHLARVFSILGMTTTLGMPLALLTIAPFADHTPASLFFAIIAAVLAGGGLIWWQGTRGVEIPCGE